MFFLFNLISIFIVGDYNLIKATDMKIVCNFVAVLNLTTFVAQPTITKFVIKIDFLFFSLLTLSLSTCLQKYKRQKTKFGQVRIFSKLLTAMQFTATS